MLRLAIFGSLFFAIMSGVWATFADPTPENAAKILNPSADDIAEANGKVTPVLEWIFAQTPDSVAQLVKDAKEDVANSLEEESAPAPGSAARSRGARAAAGAPPATGSSKQPAAAQPGIDWYKDGGK